MNALNAFKQHGLKLLATTALFGLGLTATAQQKQPAKNKADTVVTKKIIQPLHQVSDTTINGAQIKRYTEKSLLERAAARQSVNKTPSAVVQPIAPKKEEPKKLMPDDQWKKFLAEHPDWKAPKKVTPAPVKAVAPTQSVEKNSSQYKELTTHTYDSTVVILPGTHDTTKIQIKPLKERTPWRISVGDVWHQRPGSAPDPNAAGAATAPTRIANIDPSTQQGYYFRVTTPKFGKKGSFLHLFEAEAEVQIFKNKKLQFIDQQGYDEANPGAGSNSLVYDMTANSAELRNNARIGVKFAPTIGKGHIKVQPYLETGVYLQELAHIDVVKYNDPVTGVLTAPTRLLPEEKQILKNNQVSAFYAAGLSIFGDIGKPEIKNNVKTERNFYLTGNFNVFETTQGKGLGTMFSGYTHGSKLQANASIGIGYRF